MEIPALPDPLTPEIVGAHLAQVPVTDVLAAALRSDGSLVVVVNPGPKYVYVFDQVAEAVHTLLTALDQTLSQVGDFLEAVGSEQPPAAVEPEHISPLEAVQAAAPKRQRKPRA